MTSRTTSSHGRIGGHPSVDDMVTVSYIGSNVILDEDEILKNSRYGGLSDASSGSDEGHSLFGNSRRF
jgi:hypothetical protein